MVKHTVTNFEAATLPFSSCYSCLGCRGKIIPPWIRVKTDGFAVSEAGAGANARGGSVLKIARGTRQQQESDGSKGRRGEHWQQGERLAVLTKVGSDRRCPSCGCSSTAHHSRKV
ncbi:hypothetical protein BHE74_00013638 [Ensete ventricosum]|nr:hypothetical protein BHE74_00013638 [Ensete ventricosum]RZR85962.1 hypothetical protein BHM03_00013039 [Ensete ventricosum]